MSIANINNYFYVIGDGCVAYIDNDLLPTATIRHVDCHILVSTSVRCSTCTRYSSTLRVLLWRQRKDNSISRCDTNTHMNDKWRTKAELKKKLSNLRKEKRVAIKQLKRLEAKVIEMTNKEGIEVCYI